MTVWSMLGLAAAGLISTVVVAIAFVVLRAIIAWPGPRHPEREPWFDPDPLWVREHRSPTPDEWSRFAAESREYVQTMDRARRLQAWEERER